MPGASSELGTVSGEVDVMGTVGESDFDILEFIGKDCPQTLGKAYLKKFRRQMDAITFPRMKEAAQKQNYDKCT